MEHLLVLPQRAQSPSTIGIAHGHRHGRGRRAGSWPREPVEDHWWTGLRKLEDACWPGPSYLLDPPCPDMAVGIAATTTNERKRIRGVLSGAGWGEETGPGGGVDGGDDDGCVAVERDGSMTASCQRVEEDDALLWSESKGFHSPANRRLR